MIFSTYIINDFETLLPEAKEINENKKTKKIYINYFEEFKFIFIPKQLVLESESFHASTWEVQDGEYIFEILCIPEEVVCHSKQFHSQTYLKTAMTLQFHLKNLQKKKTIYRREVFWHSYKVWCHEKCQNYSFFTFSYKSRKAGREWKQQELHVIVCQNPWRFWPQPYTYFTLKTVIENCLRCTGSDFIIVGLNFEKGHHCWYF